VYVYPYSYAIRDWHFLSFCDVILKNYFSFSYLLTHGPKRPVLSPTIKQRGSIHISTSLYQVTFIYIFQNGILMHNHVLLQRTGKVKNGLVIVGLAKND
jgi:hypothetical protein